MNPESFLMAGGLNHVPKDHHRLMTAGATRMEKLLGLSQQNFNSNSAAPDAGDLNELKEEDVWGIWPDAVSNPAQYETKKEDNFQVRHKTDPVSVGGGIVGAAEPGRSLQSGSSRRWKENGGLSVAFEESNRSRLSPLTRSSALFSGTSGNRISVMMIPSADQGGNSSGSGSNSSNNSRHMMMMHHQSAPVNVPDWSKILGVGMDRRKDNPDLFTAADDEEDGGDMLPPHEYLAREQARSQMTTTSVFEGVGRTLKGRDMSRVRNAVWRQTGFLG